MANNKPNRGVLFPAKEKMSDRSPDYTGSVMPECPHCKKLLELSVAAWDQTSKDGLKYFSLSVRKENPDAEPRREHDVTNY